VSNATTRTEDDPSHAGASAAAPEVLALCVIWCPTEPSRLGEVACLPPPGPGSARLFGRGDARRDDPCPRLAFARHHPGRAEPSPPFDGETLSRAQLTLEPTPDGRVLARNVGKCPLFYGGAPTSEAALAPGDTLRLGRQIAFLLVRRPAWLPRTPGLDRRFAFGEADAHGIVGESAPAWELRRRLHFVAARAGHALVLGASGAGKELAAKALHALSPRAGRGLVARNAATIPEGLADAELFGNVKNYPNPGMADRPGLIGEANGSTLFLDEFAELPPALHAHLLRVLDAGEYQRLGEARARSSDFRLIAATNRDPAALKPDLLARFSFHVEVPDLNRRREDVPLLVRHLLRAIAAADPASVEPFCGGDGEVRVSFAFLDALVRRTYTLHARELQALLWRSLAESAGDALATPSRFDDAHRADDPPGPPAPGAPGPTPRAIEDALARHGGVLEKAWRELGLSSRHALARLMAKHRIAAPKRAR
jgi:sigma-54 interacting transcriptional regulator